MTKQTLPKWTEERTEELTGMFKAGVMATVAQVEAAAEKLETTTRSVASKLRKLGYEVQSTAAAREPSFTEEETEKLVEFVTAHEGEYTFAEIAVKVFGDAEMAKKVQGKMLSLELSGYAKKAPKKEAVRTYSEEEEGQIVSLVEGGAYVEDIAEALGREIPSIRGKLLSMLKTHGIEMPKQRVSNATAKMDPIEALGDAISEMTVEDIAEKIGKSVRGVKSMLTHRHLTVANYDGAKRAEKLAAKREG